MLAELLLGGVRMGGEEVGAGSIGSSEGLEVGAGSVGGFEGSGSERPFAFIVASVYLVPCMTVELSLLYFGW